MSSPSLSERRQKVRVRTRELREAIAAMDVVAAGTLHVRTKTCGRENCRCAKDPAARHGPYYEWTRLRDGRLAHTSLSEEQAELLRQALANRRQIEALLDRWHEETAAEVLSAKKSG